MKKPAIRFVQIPVQTTTLLFLLFLGLKLTQQIDWSWWWVTCPLWAVPAFIFAIVAICLLFAVAVFVGCGTLMFFVWLSDR